MRPIGTGALNGWVDECRYSKGMRSADWIKAEYYSTMQATWWNDPAKRFVTKGDKVGKGDETPVPVVVWETGENLPITVVNESAADGELMRIDNRFVHMYRAGKYTFTTPDYVTNIEIIVVGGGGAGGYKIGGGDGEKLTPTMVVNPTFFDVAINELAWSATPDTGDQILIPTEDSTPTILTWNSSNWGASALEQYTRANGRKGTRVIRKTDHTIGPGRGFWYYRKATGALTVTFP